MKVVHIVNLDILGGAAKAAFALNKALLNNNIDSSMLVQNKFSNDENVYTISKNFIDKFKANARILSDLIQINALTKTKKGRFSFGTVGTDITKNKLIQQSDLIHLHWINQGYLSLKSLSNLALMNKPIVWTLHDMWGFTGGCHYSSGCRNYLSTCGDCPYLIFPSAKDFSNQIFSKKKELYDRLKISFITCSEWLAGVAHEAQLLKDKIVTPIHNTLDVNVYKPLNQSEVRKKLNLSANKFLILFVALSLTEERKGFLYLKNSLIYLLQKYPYLNSEIELLILGRASADQFEGLSLNINQLGRITDEKEVAECYNAADIFLAPSLEDNLPNTVLESLSCGTPVVAFKIGGIPEMIDHLKNGYLSEERSINDFSNGVYWMFQNKNLLIELKKNARNKVLELFNPDYIAKAHISFYKNCLEK